MPGPMGGGPGRRGMRGMAPGEKPSFDVLLRLAAYVLKNNKTAWAVAGVGLLLNSLTMLISTLFTRSLIDDYIEPMMEQVVPNYDPLAAALIRLVGVVAVGIVAIFAANLILAWISQGTLKRLRVELFTNMESLPIKYFDTHPHGDIMSVYTNDVDTLRQVIAQSFPNMVESAITLIGSFISMVVLNIPLTFLSVCMVAVMLFITSRLSRLSMGYFVRQQKDLGAVNGFIEEMMEGQKVVKVFCHEEKTLEQFRELNDRLRESANNAHRIANITMPVNGNLGYISYVLCAMVGSLLALNGYTGLTLGTLVTFLTLSRNFARPVTQISQQVSSIVMAGAGARRVFDLLDQKPETDDGYVELVHAKEAPDGSLTESAEPTGSWAWKHTHQVGGVDYVRLEGSVVFDGVDFGYDPEKPVLFDIRLTAQPGQKIALVGSTGAGKTTITNLINRFYDIQDGKIRYDGINVTKIKKPDLRRSLGMVLQDTHLFTGTVMDNIRYGRLDATDEECIAAARLANAHGFIKRLPNGYQTMLTGDGGSLSQGQRQLLAIARAAVADPPVLILDEATSSIDTRTEVLVQRGMDALMTGRTSFVIAHRLSTVRNADLILVMEQGRIIEQGSHEELIEKKGRYYQLYTGNAIAG